MEMSRKFPLSENVKNAASNLYSPLKLQLKRSQNAQKRSRRFGHQDSMGISSFDDSAAAYMFSSSSDEEI
ncbi:hypothetical protein V6Z12_D06G165800 [Gossypium hirsutum]